MKADSLIRQNFSSYSCVYGHTPIQLQEDTSVPIPVYMGIHQYNYRRILQFLFLLYGHTAIQLQEDTSVHIPVYMDIHQYNYRRILQFIFLLYGHTPIQLQDDTSVHIPVLWAYSNTTTGGF